MIEAFLGDASRESNKLLARMPDVEWDRVRSHLQAVELTPRQILYSRQEQLDFVFFLRRGWVSLVVDFADGFQAEAGLVGSEGMVGTPLIHGVNVDIVAAVVQAPSEALRMSAASFSRELAQLPAFGRLLLRYDEGERTQAMQLAGCNGHHKLDARLARCLLTLQDRYLDDALPVTHELLATLLCAHRPSISVAARRLQDQALIRSSSGQLHILDRTGLERVACECYRLIRDHLQLLQPAD